jgi:tetraacyldisaccharide 4'-kinase
LRQRGFQIEAYRYADHYSYSPADFAALRDRPIIMTEKDAVKCRGFAIENAWYLKISARLPKILPQAVETLVSTWEAAQ